MITLYATEIASLAQLVVDALPERKIEQIKQFRLITGLGLKEAKDVVEAEHRRRSPSNPVIAVIEDIFQARRTLAGRPFDHAAEYHPHRNSPDGF